ncbi:hypothetical protein MVEN_00637500 [Mycena venus]|uniref:FAD/NAD(P)-binding domain-containing protein n=1 Tax=Mycena venus TaxID=2733690 RepID=A0A8H7D818_9AGAR|nr:hypothetical protein MVEN_00637500 [Mycena venus]
MSAAEIPKSTNILVIGGGPAGSYAATALAREVFEVTLLERERFPRYHIGESMLPSCRPFMRFIGAEQKVIDYGFCVKVIDSQCYQYADCSQLKTAGAALKFNQTKREGYSDFINPDPNKAAWNVVRAEFDEILLRNASDNDVRTGADMYGPRTSRENATWLEALTDESGWSWFIPLHGGRVSVGIVLKEESSRAKKASISGPDVNAQHYHNQLQLVPGVMQLLSRATFLGEVKSAGDYSYSATGYAGPNYRIAGDAGAFASITFMSVDGILKHEQIDPFFSSGVHLAFSSGLSAASSIAASIRGQCTEADAIKFHTDKTGTSYTRYLLVVLSAYRQITSQSVPVLSDIEEDNFDRAFEFIRPIIQGAADTDPTVTEEMLQATTDFCEHALGLTDPEMHEAVASRIDPQLMAEDGPILGPKDVAAIAGGDEETEAVLRRINSRKAVESLVDWQPNFRGESFNGLSIFLERGNLGLRRTPVVA